ncbi:MAG: hypothetical protein ACRDMZ_07255 [Solirubrobacteraceae bacterium]
MKTTAPLLRGGGELHIVGSRRVVTLDDPDGAIHRLVELADGSRSTNELFSLLAPQYPALHREDLLNAVSDLEAAGLVENCVPRRRMPAELAAPAPY